MISLLKRLNKKDCFLIFISFILIIIEVYLDLKIPDYMAQITRLIETKGSLLNDILVNGGYMLLCAVVSLIAAIIVGFIATYISASFAKNIRHELFKQVADYSMSEINKFKTSSLITRATNDVTNIQRIIAIGMQLIMKAPIMAIWAISKILNKSWQWSLLTFVAVIIILLTIIILMIIVVPRFKIVQKLIDDINGLTSENIKGIRVIRAFNAEDYQQKKFAKTNDKLANIRMFNQKTLSILMPVMNLVMYGLTLGIYFIGAYLISAATLSQKLTIFGNMIVFSSYAMQVIMAFLMLAMIFLIYPRASISAKRINEVLDEKLSIKNGLINKKMNDLKGVIEFKNVTFKYPDAKEPLLQNISFKLKQGQTLAIIGLTGCGKTTLIQLIPRLFDVTKGKVLINGIDVKDYDLEYLHNLIGYVPQKAVMFNGTVKFNVFYGANNQQENLKVLQDAIKIAQANDFVDKMPNKYNAHISQGGTNLSGGQKQRLAIARAIAKNPEIYIFDDAFSALDFKTDLKLRQELKKYTKDATNIIVAQRIGTVLHADMILVLDKGKCVGFGTHQELLRSCKLYKEIALSQITKEELANV